MDYDLSFDYPLSAGEYKRLVSKKTDSFFEENKALEGRILELKKSIRDSEDSDAGNYDDIYDLMRTVYFRRLELIDFLKNITLNNEKARIKHNNLINKLETKNEKRLYDLYGFIEGQLSGDIPSDSIVPD